MAKEKKVIQADIEDSPTLEGKLEVSVLAKDFPYPEFMDKELMTPILLEQLQGDDEHLAKKFQWAGHELLKLVASFRYSELVISSGVRAIKEVKDLKEKVALLEGEKLALEKARRVEIEELKGQVQLRDQQQADLKAQILELKKAFVESSKAVSKLKSEVKYIKEQWGNSAFEIKANTLAQCQVICLKADFGELGLDKHVVDGWVEVTPIGEEEGDCEDPVSESANPTADL